MTKIYDFTKYKTDQEISMYEEEKITECFSCPECEGIGFMITTDYAVNCVECLCPVSVDAGAKE